MKLHRAFFSLFVMLLSTQFAQAESVLETYPGLKKFVSSEKSSNLYFGFGISPFNLVNNKIGFSASLFQVHYVKDNFDIEFFNVTAGTFFGTEKSSEQFFLLKFTPKYKIFKNISLGPMVGMEFVHFPGVQTELNKDSLFSPPTDFSTVGAVYGATLSETFEIGDPEKHNLLRVSETIFKETYSVSKTKEGWSYYYLDNSLNADSSVIAPSVMFMLEVSYLF